MGKELAYSRSKKYMLLNRTERKVIPANLESDNYCPPMILIDLLLFGESIEYQRILDEV
jgi:hypothetical protein